VDALVGCLNLLRLFEGNAERFRTHRRALSVAFSVLASGVSLDLFFARNLAAERSQDKVFGVEEIREFLLLFGDFGRFGLEPLLG
jgi:hypothetical protein